MTDPIADMLTRIKNATMARKALVQVPHSNLKMEIAKILEREGYIASLERNGKKARKILELGLFVASAAGSKHINDIRRVSKSSRRIYAKANEIRRVKNGFGLALLSTSKGLKTDGEARKENIGGEIICEIW